MDTIKKIRQRVCLQSFLAVVVFIGLLGAAMPVLFNEGSAATKYLVKKQQLERVQEQDVEDYMSAALFGEGKVAPLVQAEQADALSEEEAFAQAQRWRSCDRIIIGLLLAASFLLLFPSLRRRKLLYYLLLPIVCWLILNSIALGFNGGKKFSNLAFWAHATRWGAPLCLFLLLKAQAKSEIPGKALTALALFCCSSTFAVHGWEALNLHPAFEDLIYACSGLVGYKLPTASVHLLLKLIGGMDICLALALFFFRRQKLLLWMAVWGFLTALSRPLAMGVEAWPETAMRIANCAMPLFLYLVYSRENLINSMNNLNNNETTKGNDDENIDQSAADNPESAALRSTS